MKLENEAGQSRADDILGESIGEVTETIQPIQNSQVVLPAGVSLEDLTVEGRDLIVTLADGSRIVIPDGAVDVPAIVIDGVIVPPQNVAQLLTGNEPEPDAGAVQSSGGNFAGDEGEIQAAFNIGDLLPFTELAFPEFPEEEIIPNVDEEPEVVIETIDNPVGVENAVSTVDENGLPERGEPEGTAADTDSESTSGTIVFEATDGLSDILINGVSITGPGQVISTPVGDLTIISINFETGEIDFDYTLTDNLVGEGTDPFIVTIIDADGDEATATLDIVITDDGPIAANDLGVVEAGSHDPITGDVLVNDVSGADGYAPEGAVQGFSNASGTAEPGDTLQGEFGTLTLNADGTYTYVRDLDTPGGVEESFEYTIVDADGSTSSAVLTIQIEDAPAIVTEVPRIGDGTSVNESALAPRNDEPVGSSEGADGDADNNSDPTENTGATISFNSPDGLDSITLNGIVLNPGNLPQTVISDGTGTLVVTGITYDPVTGDGTIEYEYTLIDNTAGDDTTVEVVIVVTDLDGDAAEDTLVINIIDDEPAAADDSEGQAGENTPVTIDVLANDTPGADDVDPSTIVVVDGTLSGDGSLVNNGDGTFTYTPAPGEDGTVTFDYTITDGDGDEATATATIDLLPDSEPEIAAEGDDVADEAGLGVRGDEPAGSDAANDSEFAEGTISINTGNDTVASLVVNGTDVTNGGTVTTDKGVLTVTLNAGVYEYTYELTDNTLTEPDSDPFTVTVTDSDGDTASTTIVISILDDAPSAEDDSGTIGAGEFGPIGGDVLANDTQGADGATVTSYTGAGGSGDAGETVQGEYGVLTIAADGTFSYTRDPGTPGGVSDTFNYTITDGDGDTASADIVITIGNAPTTLDLPAAGQDGTLVDEAGLDGPPAGTDAASGSEATDGTFTFTAPDGPATVTIGGVAITAVGQTFNGTFGTLEITSIADGAIGYTYTLDGNTEGDATTDSFDVRVTDIDGDFSESALEIAIIDDVPTANSDSNSVTEGSSVSGNVLIADGNGSATDIFGADGSEAAGGVVGVRAAGGDTTTDVSGNVSTTISGLYGTLTLNADGSYTYVATPDAITSDAADVFVYTIEDGDGDLSTTTLTIDVADITLAPDIETASANEAALDLNQDGEDLAAGTVTGSNPSSTSETTTGQLAVAGTGVTYTLDSGSDNFGTLVLNPDGSYTYTLTAPVSTAPDANDGTNTEAGAETYNYTATDADGNTVTGTITIDIIDDVPTANADSDSVTEDGPLVADGNVLTGTGGTDANATDGATDVAGADGATVTGVAFGDTGADVDGNVGTDVSGDYGTLSIADDGSYVYTLDNTNGTVQGLDATESLIETFTYTITDGDGDTATTTVTVTVNGSDDPVVVNGLDLQVPELSFDEDDLADGSSPDAAALTKTGTFEVTSADGLATLTVGGTTVFDANNPVTFPVTIDDPVYGLLTITGVVPTTDADGDVVAATVSYSYTLQDNSLLHTGGNDGSFTDSFAVVGTDTDGSTDTGSLDIQIIDDVPAATDNSADVDEGASVSGNVLTDDDGAGVDVAGADGFGTPSAVTEIFSVGENTTQSSLDASGNLVITTSLGTLTVDPANGDYTYVSNANSTNSDVTDSFTYTIVDGDGDLATANLVIDIVNAPGQVSDNDVIVNEAGLATGSDPAATSEIDADGQIAVAGASGTLVYNLLSPADGAFGTLVLDATTGAYTYTLDTPFTDNVTENGTNTVNGAESFDYEVRDSLGNLIGTGSIDVSIIDDIPTATDQANITVAEDAAGTIGGNVTIDGVADTEGADGAAVTAITIGTVITAVPQDGSSASVTTANGVYTIDMDGNWTFDPTTGLDQSAGDVDASFTYTLTDGDGDFDTAEQPITIIDGQIPQAGPDITLALDDQNLADGSTPAGDDFASDTIVFTEGSDAIAGIVFGDVSALGGGLTWTRVSDTQITGEDGGRLVVTLDLSVTSTTATVTATLNDNFDDHPTINVDDLVDLGDVDVIATDIDGDSASSTVSVTVSDDLPTITASAPGADALTVDETDLATDATADFSSLFTSAFNGDNPGTPEVYTLGVNAGPTGLVDTATNEAVVLTLNGNVVEGRTAGSGDLVFTVSVDATGTVTLDQQRAVKHADTTDNNDDATLAAANLITLTATIVDSDGDTAAATANIAGAMTFLDDGPDLSNVTLGSSVSVDETDGLTTSATSAASIISFTSDFGEDGDNGTAFTLIVTDANTGLATADGDFPITLVQTSANVITGVFDDGSGSQTAFTATINADGTITLAQNVALEHQIDGDNSAGEHNDTLNLDGNISATVIITDGDGDTDTATVPVGSALTFFDDGPSVVLSGINDALSVSDADFGADDAADFSDNFTFDGGEDGTAATSFAVSATDGTDSGLVDTATGNSVFLFAEAGEVVGREGADAASAASGAVVFTVSVDASGTVELDQNRAVDHTLSTGSDGASVSLASDGLIQLIGTVTDNDGDTASQALDIGSNLSFTDDIPAAGANNTVILDDDALGGNAGGTGDDIDADNVTGTLDHDFGNDGGSIAFATTGAPAGFQYVASGDDILIQQDQGSGFVTVVTVTLDTASGDYTVTQNLNILHADGDAENNTEFTIGYTVTDGDTDTATSSLVINVDDDTPTATDDGEIASVDDNVSGENVGTIAALTGNDSYGADGAGTPAITIAAGTLGGTVTIDGSGNLLYTSATDITAPYADQVETFTYTITDGDGDTASATFQIRLTDEGPAINADAATFTVDEEGLGGIAGNGDDGGDVAGEITVQSGTLSGIDFGTDGAGDVTLTAVADTGLVTLAGNAVETVWDGSTGTLTGQDAVTGDDVFTLVITDVATGAYTFTLLAPIAHPVADTEDDQSFTVGVVVTDAEGESASGTISITIDDDSPVAVDDTNALTEDTSSVSGNVVTDPVADEFGADGAGDPEVTAVTGFGGAAGAVNGSTIGEFGTLTLNDDGSYTYNLNTALVQGLDDGESETDAFTYTIVDADGDTSDATLTITINGANDAPVAVADTNWTVEDAAAAITGNVLQTVAHNGAPDAAPRGDVADTDVDGDALSVTTTGTFNGTYGILTLNSDGTYSYDLYTAAQNQAGFDAVQALDEGDAPLSDVFNYTASDGDASSNAALTIDIFGANDAPEVIGSVAAVSEEGLAGGLADTAGNPTDTTNGFSDTGQITITDADDATFTVTLGAPTTPGLTSNGLPINWQVSTDGTALVGSTTAGNVLLASIDDAGNWTVDLVGPIDHSDATSEDVFTFDIPVSVSDGTATTSITDGITVTIEDDSPDASLDAAGLSVTHDETAGNDSDADDVTGPIAAFAGVTNTGDDPDVAGTVIGFAQDIGGLVSTGAGLGGDGAGSTVFELNVSSAGVDSGLNTTEGADIVLFKEGDVIVGRVGGQSGEAAFAVAVDSTTGAVSTVQYLSIEHPIGGTASPDEAVSIASGAIIASVTATDADGDTSTASAAIGDAISFEDDAGTLGAATPATQTIGNFANASAGGIFAYDTGSDGHGSFDITGPALTGVSYSLDQNAVDITDDSVNNPIAGATLTATADSTGETLFTISVDEDGNYEFTLVTPEAATTETISLLGLSAGGPTPFVETATGNIEFSSTTGGVNSSTVGFGVDNQFVGAGDKFQVEFHNPGQPGDQAPLTNPDFVTSASLGNDRDGGNVVYKITIFNDATGQSEVVFNGLISTSSTLIQPITLTEFNRFEVEGVSGGGQGARFTSLDFSKTILPGDADLDFQVTATDGDGDVTSSSTVNVMVDASIAAPTSSASGASPLAFSTSRMLLDDPLEPVSNDNEGGRGSGSGVESLTAMQESSRSDMRLAETTLVAAISGAVLIDQTLSASSSEGQIAAGSVSYDLMPIDAAMIAPTIDGAEFNQDFDMSMLMGAGSSPSSGETDWGSLSADDALATSGELSIGLQAEPDHSEPVQFDSGFDAFGQSAFFDGTAAGVDQAMEALLMMEPGAQATATSLSADPSIDGLSGGAEAVLADIVAETAIDQLLESLTDGNEASHYLVTKSGAIDMGLLNQTIEGSMSMIEPVDLMKSQADEAAATVAAA